MKLYNTLTKKIDEVKPINPPVITVYTCGPTVYDYPHIGNWFTFIRYDILIRTLLASQYKVKWVMNITDVGHLTSDADEGESTALYIQQQLTNHEVKISRLAQGLPIGVDLEYADQITLGRAIEHRQSLSNYPL